MVLKKIFATLSRQKTFNVDENGDGESKLARVLTLTDLAGLGVGSTLGVGVYVLAGSVAKTVAGPAVCLSFLIAAVASGIAGLCYAEFAARVPKAGSAYIYSYVTVGEFVAYIIGWNLILEYVIGTASVARGLSSYIDALANKTIQQQLIDWMPMDVAFLSSYPDFLSFLFVMTLTALLAFGVKESSRLNNIFTGLNLVTIGIIVIAGAIKANPSNWNISKSDIPKDVETDPGEGGFMPFGFAGVMAGAAKCFYGFVGYDAVATTGEEAINPKRNIPLAIVISLVVIFLSYFSISVVLTMMWPYYDQNAEAPFPHAFDHVEFYAIKWIVTIGAIFALFTSLLGAMFPLPRVIYAMSKDGLIFKKLSAVHSGTQTPLLATVLSGLFAGIMAILFNIDQLIDMMSIGTLLAYTIVAMCVLILRYQPTDADNTKNYHLSIDNKDDLTNERFSFYSLFKLLFNLNMNKYPNSLTTSVVYWSLLLFSVLSCGFCAFIIFAIDLISTDEPHYLIIFILVTVLLLSSLLIMARQPINDEELSFRVPWVPVVPCISLLMNIYLMLVLDGWTWIRFVVWLVVGFLIYFFYGIKQSVEGRARKELMTNESRNNNKETTKF